MLAAGTVDHRPDYSYRDHMNLELYKQESGSEAVCQVPSPEGSIVNRITAKRSENCLEITMDERFREMEIRVYLGEELHTFVLPEGVTEHRIILS